MLAQHRIILSARAKRDIMTAADWYVQQSTMQLGAEWVLAIEKKIHTLSQFPERCPLVAGKRHKKVRQLLFGRKHGQYRILFSIEGKTVHILHIQHSARDRAKP